MSSLDDLHRRLRRRLRGTSGDAFLPAPAQPPASSPPPGSGEESFLPAANLPPPLLTPEGGPPGDGDSFLPPRAESHATRAVPEFAALGAALPGREITGALGGHYVVARRGAELAADAPQLHAGWHAARGRGRGALKEVLALDPSGIVFLDLETCGLRGKPLFLIGLARLGDEDVELELLLARDLGEESAVIAAAAQRLAGAEALVTFNGRSFDVPFLQERARYWRVPVRVPPLHLDLLESARRRWKHLPNHKLQTIEHDICGRERDDDDVPGAEIPGVYRQFTATGNGALLRPIVEHNAQDLLTLVALAARLTSAG